jgi:lycopene cyclase domain-containing protein
MTYWLLNAIFLAIVVLVAFATILTGRSPRWRIIGLSAIPLVVLTAVFDNILVGTRIVAYDRSRISGAFIGVAPLEDFTYVIAAVVLLPCLWMLLTPRRRSAAAAPPPDRRGYPGRRTP